MEQEDLKIELIDNRPPGMQPVANYTDIHVTHVKTGLKIVIPWQVRLTQHKKRNLAIALLELAIQEIDE